MIKTVAKDKNVEKDPGLFVPLTRYAWLSIGAAILTLCLKISAYLLTSSIGLLSDALESTINLAAAIVALQTLRMITRPPDDEFAFGYSKMEYFASGFEGAMILVAALGIMVSAIPRLIEPIPLEQIGMGLAISVSASLINLVIALILIRAGKRNNSITLEADGHHLMTDVWTTGGVLIGIALVWLTGYARLDPIVALLVALNIVVTGYRLLVRSGRGLLDISLPDKEIKKVISILNSYQDEGVGYHALRSRQAASRKFLVVHLLVPGKWTIDIGHQLADRIENEIRASIPEANIVTHIEPVEDPISLLDVDIIRK